MFAILGFFGLGTQEVLLVVLLLLFIVLPTWFSCKIAVRAGFSAALGLITLIPFGLLVYLAILAFAEWPAERPAGGDDVAYRE